jgi:cbb3-type cytochrome oxidase subunit 3
MRLSDVMGNSGLAGYAVIAMILFMLAFVAIVVRIFRPSRRDEMERARQIPFDDTPVKPGSGDPQ